jgi:moderate conductance mechanosensitive channel
VKVAADPNDPRWVQRLDDLHLLTALRVVAIIVVALVFTWLTRALVRRLARRVFVLPGVDTPRARVRQQAIGTVLRSAIVGCIWATAVIAVVGLLGVNVGGLIATATVVGGAIAFGAQTLIRDAIAGFFVLAEDQYGVGDVVDVGVATGVVERITLRSVRLRDGEGTVWHVPHGGIPRTANLSKAPRAVLDIEVDRSMRLDRLEPAVSDLIDELRAHPVAGPVLVGDVAVDGVIEVRDDRLIHRISTATKVGHHDDVKTAWRLLTLRAFERGDLVAPPITSIVVQMPGVDA